MKTRAPRNRTTTILAQERKRLEKGLITDLSSLSMAANSSGIILGDCEEVGPLLPRAFADLMILDPPYNLAKNFNGRRFSRRSPDEYSQWLEKRLALFRPLLKETATVYICGDWRSSPSIFAAASHYFIVRNRITWEREKGRAAAKNWKNSSEDIWFCTVSNKYTFDLPAVKLRRLVMAPYRDKSGRAKDWFESGEGKFRDTAPSNIWTDITIPFWSMPENTDHPTQKSEKLAARLILASSRPGDIVFDPYLGSGTTAVAAKKLGRRYLGIEIDRDYCLLAQKRLEIADTDATIQGYVNGVFWERNTLKILKR